MSDEPKELEVEVAGHPEPTLMLRRGICECGNITDGVALSHGRRGGWVISFADLKRIYEAAKAERVKP